jgi:CBS domain containing-hemolysin-like protein
MSDLLSVTIIMLLILFNGVFVAAEFAVVTASRIMIEGLAKRGSFAARRLHAILEQPARQDRYIATAQLGITLASLGLGMYGEHYLASIFYHWLQKIHFGGWLEAHVLASFLTIVFLTYFHIVIGEMIPKALALARAENSALLVTPLMLISEKVMYPLVFVANGLANSLLRFLGVRRELGGHHYLSAEELEVVIEESRKGGALGTELARVVRELFDFESLIAEEVMVPRVKVTGIPLGASSAQIREILLSDPHTLYPVYRESLDRIVGQVHVRNLLECVQAGRIRPGDVRPISFLPETVHLEQVLTEMRESGTSMIVVLDEHGGTAGIVTMEDLFEEVAGNIEEGAGEKPSMAWQQPGHTLQARGVTRLEEVGDQFGRLLEHPEVKTVTGLILTLLRRPPVVGDRVGYKGFEFEVTAVAGYAVEECRISLSRTVSGPPKET